jgi:hypothetical protein
LFTAYKDEVGDIWAEHVVEERFADMLDECYGAVTLMGHEYDHARALREVDPILYHIALSEYMDEFEEVSFDTLDEYLDALS